jgi:hypothetical protein
VTPLMPNHNGVPLGGAVDLAKRNREHTRATRGGELVPSPEFPRVGLAGPPGTQIEVAHTPGFTHAILTVVGGSNMAACGIQTPDLREHIRHCQKLLEQMDPTGART